ncbi:hypothetical protein ABIB25_004321 [Nakamurella sp. UYEF19]|uniref:DUF4262 domain-containing protein n=1 Tax=Nakamurella sp. UYEF19 TaxID=1756392 RepID=UPI003395B52C
MTEEQSLANVRDQISRFGWSITAVEGAVDDEGVFPAFAYSIGFTRHRLPEILISGRPTEEAYQVLNQLGNGIKRGLRLVPEVRLTIAGLNLFFLPIASPANVLLTAGAVYQNRQIEALQAIWADSEGHFPWEQAIPDDLTQPLFCQLPNRWHYCQEHQPPE